ncbi:MAG: hypothetical protein J7647_30855 [Cyanobacteria bacterium SBLK]|nr:hypothetical protein [Cyanobacteria bacterium SBLK]
MRLAPKFVPVRRIATANDRNQFDAQKIETLAQAILDVQGLAVPLHLKRDGENYILLNEDYAGRLAYWAAVRAREINLRKGEMVSAFIKDDDKDNAVARQMDILQAPAPTATAPTEKNWHREMMSGYSMCIRKIHPSEWS